jgi:hypothetical protein
MKSDEGIYFDVVDRSNKDGGLVLCSDGGRKKAKTHEGNGARVPDDVENPPPERKCESEMDDRLLNAPSTARIRRANTG